MSGRKSGRAPGRGPGRPAEGADVDTRQALLESARQLFAQRGFDGTTLRAVAQGAGVDAALIAHYFGGKRGLYVAAIDFPVDPQDVLAPVWDAPRDRVGVALVRALAGVWDSEAGVAVVAMFRSLIGAGDVGSAQAFAMDVALAEVFDHLGLVDEAERRLRSSLVVSQLAGLLLARKVALVEPLASLPVDEVADLLGPTVQRYLVGPFS